MRVIFLAGILAFTSLSTLGIACAEAFFKLHRLPLRLNDDFPLVVNLSVHSPLDPNHP